MKKLIELKNMVEDVFDLRDISIQSRKVPLPEARAVFCYLADKHFGASYFRIGEMINLKRPTIWFLINNKIPALLIDPKYGKLLLEADNRVKTEQNRHSWISVKEALPVRVDNFLCRRQFKGIISIERFFPEHPENWIKFIGVTHWMELPKQPEL